MNGHDLASVAEGDRTATAVCECGKRYVSPNAGTARARWAYHSMIEGARAALRGDKENDE